MKKALKKLSILAASTAMIAAMSVPAFAAESFDNSMVGAGGATVTFSDTFKISEGDNAQNLPAAEFQYSIAPGTGAAATANTPKILAGLDGAQIAGGSHEATAAGITEDTVDVTADFSNVNFSEAGIYRYSISEELGDSNVKEDIEIDTNNENKGTYVLDVYVKNNEGSFDPYAYILSKTGENASAVDGNQTVITYTDKINTIVNEYTTYDLTVSKKIVGDMAANSFEFTIDLNNLSEDVIIDQDGTDYTDATSYVLKAELANEKSTVIKGLPSTAAYAVKEAVNQLEGYEVEVIDSNENAGEYNWIGEEGQAAEFGNEEAAAIGKADVTIDYTNTLRSISPTGVIIRFAPYILILGAGIILLVVSRRRRAQ